MSWKGGIDGSSISIFVSMCLLYFSMTKVLKCAGGDDMITIRAEEGGDVVNFLFESPSEFVSLSRNLQIHSGIIEGIGKYSITANTRNFVIFYNLKYFTEWNITVGHRSMTYYWCL